MSGENKSIPVCSWHQMRDVPLRTLNQTKMAGWFSGYTHTKNLFLIVEFHTTTRYFLELANSD
jgi:hypothetical protein